MADVTWEPLNNNYQPDIWHVKADTMYDTIVAMEAGLAYAKECLLTHETTLGRTTLKNKTWAEIIERDIRHLELTLKNLRDLK
jgi:hypothetical protein